MSRASAASCRHARLASFYCRAGSAAAVTRGGHRRVACRAVAALRGDRAAARRRALYRTSGRVCARASRRSRRRPRLARRAGWTSGATARAAPTGAATSAARPTEWLARGAHGIAGSTQQHSRRSRRAVARRMARRPTRFQWDSSERAPHTGAPPPACVARGAALRDRPRRVAGLGLRAARSRRSIDHCIRRGAWRRHSRARASRAARAWCKRTR